MKNFTMIMFLVLCQAHYAQTFEWVKTPETDLGFNPDLSGYSTACDNDGNSYFLGFKDDPFVYNDVMGTLSFIKYSATGEILFSKEIAGRAASYDLITDSEGNTIVALGYYDSITIDEVSLTAAEQEDHFLLAKFSPGGELLWYEPVVLTGTDWNYVNAFHAIAVDTQDSVYIGFGNFIDSYVNVYSRFGNFLYTIAQENVGRITSVSVDSAGNVYTAGSCAAFNASFGGTVYDSGLVYNTYVAKYTYPGQPAWVKFVEDITCSAAIVKAYSENEIYFSSDLNGSAVFDNITTEGPVSAVQDFFLAKFNAEGAYQWVREVPGAGQAVKGNRRFLTTDVTGNIYFTGTAAGDINWGNGHTTGTGTGFNTGLLLEYNNSGDVIMAKTFANGSYNITGAVAVSNDNDIYVSGVTYGNAAFDEITTTSGADQFYPFLAKIGESTMGNGIPSPANVVIHPNPVQAVLKIDGLREPAAGKIINMLGQEIQYFSGITRSLPVTSLPQGTYFLLIDNKKPIKFIKS